MSFTDLSQNVGIPDSAELPENCPGLSSWHFRHNQVNCFGWKHEREDPQDHTASAELRAAKHVEIEHVWGGSVDPTLKEYISMSDKAQRDEAWSEIGITGSNLWPDVFERRGGQDVAMPSSPSTSSRKLSKSDETCFATNFGCPGGQPLGTWLMEPKLRGHTLDVIIRNSESSHKSRYNNKIGTLVVPTGRLITLGNRNNSLDVTLGTFLATKRAFKIWHIYPLATTEFKGAIDAASARSILHAMGAHVVIIGPDEDGSTQYIDIIVPRLTYDRLLNCKRMAEAGFEPATSCVKGTPRRTFNTDRLLYVFRSIGIVSQLNRLWLWFR
ncbi:hypothetical protein B0H19DRAFT_1229451 [Mycena capillaripes]|nr:hypothetical protein B0H19DRAFT_1229451 [Mycena capillaripes]